jgi:hypothetical protein
MATNETPGKKLIVTDSSESEAVPVRSAPPLDEVEGVPESPLPPLPIPPVTKIDTDRVDPDTARAVDEIYAEEQKQQAGQTDEEPVKPDKPKGRLRRAWSGWWHSPLKRRMTWAVLFIGIGAAFVVPTSRYVILNNTGVRASASIVVLDDSTQQPLKNVDVTLGEQKVTTDKEGRAAFYNLRLGPARLVVQRRAFAAKEQTVTIGWGSNPLKSLSLSPVGTQYQFAITDYLSGQPIAKAEASVGESTAVSDEQGAVKLTLENIADEQTATVQISAAGYRTEKVTLDLNTDDTSKLQLVPAKSHVFISKRSGRYDVYKVDIDGKNEEKILSGSGIEKDDLVLVQHPTKDYAVLVSTRENVRDKDGYLLSTLTLIDTKNKTPTKIAQSQRIQIVDWIGDRLVFVKMAPDAAADDPARHRLMSYDVQTGATKEIASANYFNDVLVANGSIFFAPSAAYSTSAVAFYKVNADGTNKQTALDQEVWNVFRSDYDKLVLAVGQDWYEYQISTNKSTHLGGEPSNLTSRVYIDNQNHTKSLWVDQRDGKGVLLVYDVASKTDKVLYAQGGQTYPVQWLNDSAVFFRINTSSETADYALSLNGSEPKKIQDVTNTTGVDRWYYY